MSQTPGRILVVRSTAGRRLPNRSPRPGGHRAGASTSDRGAAGRGRGNARCAASRGASSSRATSQVWNSPIAVTSWMGCALSPSRIGGLGAGSGLHGDVRPGCRAADQAWVSARRSWADAPRAQRGKRRIAWGRTQPQSNRSGGGGRGVGTSVMSPRWVRIFRMTTGSSMVVTGGRVTTPPPTAAGRT